MLTLYKNTDGSYHLEVVYIKDGVECIRIAGDYIRLEDGEDRQPLEGVGKICVKIPFVGED